MKKVLFFYLLLPVLILSCDGIDQYKSYKLDGMWQLKTVQDIDGNKIHVDTVYYSFQRETIFSFTVLNNSKSASVIYGYVDMPSDDKVHVLIDDKSSGDDNFKRFLSLSGWSAADVVFNIKKYNKSNLVLFDSGNGKTYTLKKF